MPESARLTGNSLNTIVETYRLIISQPLMEDVSKKKVHYID
ncbi:hypothetical protein FH603_4237 [Spirosoma sp. LMG 31447]|uniref:Uncharacterized protein n=1 Tax=Spirosoma utsteinense TaxID=2585773 RepID=A0ABR6WB26_9BACT|nr:hypothetical protein [Spirosoma utsteinense]